MSRVMDRQRKLELVLRSLALKHKLKVHDSIPHQDTHEELALNQLARWELEDELHAIEEILSEARLSAVAEKKAQIEKKGPKKRKSKK